MRSKDYQLPNGEIVVFEYDMYGIGKVSLKAMDMIMEQFCKPTWIPCSERLPKEGETVLVCFSPGQGQVWGSSRVIEFGRINSDREELEGVGWEWLNESACNYWEPDWRNMVIAWIPLPMPYKEKNDDQ